MLGVTVANHLSAGEHVRDFIRKSAQSITACPETAALLRHERGFIYIYDAVTYTRPSSSPSCCMHASSPVWWGFIPTQRGWQATSRSICLRAIRLGLYTAGDPTLSQLAADMDDKECWRTTFIRFHSHSTTAHPPGHYSQNLGQQQPLPATNTVSQTPNSIPRPPTLEWLSYLTLKSKDRTT